MVGGEVGEGRGVAWVRAARQAMRSRVRGEGEGRGEVDEGGLTRWMVVPLGVVEGLVDEGGCSEGFGSRSKVGWRKMMRGRVAALPFLGVSSLLCPFSPPEEDPSTDRPSITSAIAPWCDRSLSLLGQVLRIILPCFSLSYQIHCPTRHRSTKT